MPLDRQAKRILGMLAAGGMPPRSSDFTAPKLRESMLHLARTFDVQGALRSALSRIAICRAWPALCRYASIRRLPSARRRNPPRSSISTAAPVCSAVSTRTRGFAGMLANASALPHLFGRLPPRARASVPGSRRGCLLRHPMALRACARGAHRSGPHRRRRRLIRRHACRGRVPASQRNFRPCACAAGAHLSGDRLERPHSVPGRLTGKATSSKRITLDWAIENYAPRWI